MDLVCQQQASTWRVQTKSVKVILAEVSVKSGQGVDERLDGDGVLQDAFQSTGDGVSGTPAVAANEGELSALVQGGDSFKEASGWRALCKDHNHCTMDNTNYKE
jgi:hypothetical protein